MATQATLRAPAVALETVIVEIRALLGDRVSTTTATREQHGHDESWHHPAMPDAVCFVQSTAEVAAIVKACNTHRVPVIAYGVGTSIDLAYDPAGRLQETSGTGITFREMQYDGLDLIAEYNGSGTLTARRRVQTSCCRTHTSSAL